MDDSGLPWFTPILLAMAFDNAIGIHTLPTPIDIVHRFPNACEGLLVVAWTEHVAQYQRISKIHKTTIDSPFVVYSLVNKGSEGQYMIHNWEYLSEI